MAKQRLTDNLQSLKFLCLWLNLLWERLSVSHFVKRWPIGVAMTGREKWQCLKLPHSMTEKFSKLRLPTFDIRAAYGNVFLKPGHIVNANLVSDGSFSIYEHLVSISNMSRYRSPRVRWLGKTAVSIVSLWVYGDPPVGFRALTGGRKGWPKWRSVLHATHGVPPSMDLCIYSLILLPVSWRKIHG